MEGLWIILALAALCLWAAFGQSSSVVVIFDSREHLGRRSVAKRTFHNCKPAIRVVPGRRQP